MTKPSDDLQPPPPPKTIAERRAERGKQVDTEDGREDVTHQLAGSLAKDIRNEYGPRASVSHNNNRLNISRSSDGGWLQIVVEDADRYGVTTGTGTAPLMSQEVFDRDQLLDRLDRFLAGD